jgi:hypothetical protein
MKLPDSVKAWNTAEFKKVFSDEITIDTYDLPLVCYQGGIPDENSIEVTVRNYSENDDFIVVKFSISFTEIVSTDCSAFKRFEGALAEFECKIDMKTGEAELLTDHQDYS